MPNGILLSDDPGLHAPGDRGRLPAERAVPASGAAPRAALMRAGERTADRRVTAAGLWAAGGFLLLVIASAALPPNDRLGTWLPLHLALAGAAAQAIGAALPFFTASLLAGRPARWEVRAAVQVLLGTGAFAVSAGMAAHLPPVAAAGGVAFVSGIGLLACVAFLPLRHALGSRHSWVLAAYAAAFADVACGASIATLEVAGFGPVATGWAWLMPAHAWLNLLGFVSLVIAGTLLHLYPTVVGSRIARGLRMRAMVSGLALGASLVGLAYVLRADPIGRAGAATELVGTIALVAYVGGAWRVRGRWTGDLAWRRVAIGSLGAGVAWFAFAAGVAAGRVLLEGATPEAWSFEVVGAPLAAGWMAQSIVGAWTHLLPAVLGGSPRRHARQRRILGLAGAPRIVALNAGVAILTIGLAGSSSPATAAGAVVVAGSLILDLVLLLGATVASEPAA